MLQAFLPQFCMTFFICLFILMMQFLFRYINDLVGKGLGLDVLSELFFYAALTMVPMALPLAILLASLMTFGNLGEHVELTALKSSGISLIRSMRPLIVLVSVIAVGAFFFQNDVLPRSQVKMWTLLFSARQKQLTLDIPEGAIYSQIPGYNVYVKHKGEDNGMLYDVLIYNMYSGGAFPRIVAADSGHLSTTDDMKHIVLKLYHGYWYEDLSASGGSQFGQDMFRREVYHDKEILIPYDATFNRMDDQLMSSQYIGKNITELRHAIDSIQVKVDSVGDQISDEMLTAPVMGVPENRSDFQNGRRVITPTKPLKIKTSVNIDSLFKSFTPEEQQSVLAQASSFATSAMQNAQFRSFSMADDAKNMRRHQIELQKKFTLSLACLIFFFIGAPLGAIIRKGGLGTPVVISLLLFIVYYIIDNMGYKLARDGRWPVTEGIWLSSAVLLPLGIFLTYKAVNDSAVLNPDAYRNFFRRLIGKKLTRHLELKEVIMDEVNPTLAMQQVRQLQLSCDDYLQTCRKPAGYVRFWLHNSAAALRGRIVDQANEVADYLSNSRDQHILGKASQLPVFTRSALQRLTAIPRLNFALMVIFPVGLLVYLVDILQNRRFIKQVRAGENICAQLLASLSPSQLS